MNEKLSPTPKDILDIHADIANEKSDTYFAWGRAKRDSQEAEGRRAELVVMKVICVNQKTDCE